LVAVAVVDLEALMRRLVAGRAAPVAAVLGGVATLSVQVTSLRHLLSLLARLVLRAQRGLRHLAARWLGRAAQAAPRSFTHICKLVVVAAVGRVRLPQQAAAAAGAVLDCLSGDLAQLLAESVYPQAGRAVAPGQVEVGLMAPLTVLVEAGVRRLVWR